MGMFDAKVAANVAVRPSASYLRAGIHNVKFTGVAKGDNPQYVTLDFTFEAEDGSVHTERMFEPRSNERQPNRFNTSIEDPSPAEQFMCKLMHIISALNPDVYQKIQTGAANFAPGDFDTLITLVKKILDPKVGTEVQVKLLPNGRFVGFPGFPARLDKAGNLYLSTSFIGTDLTLSAYEKAAIDKAANATPTNMSAVAKDTSELDDLNLTDSSDDDSDLPF